jgi:hypothetical protein
MQTYFEVIHDGPQWVVRCQAAEYGRFKSQVQAFNAAVSEARKIKDTGRIVHVRVVRDTEARAGDFLSLL